jgi:hypothetical protein
VLGSTDLDALTRSTCPNKVVPMSIASIDRVEHQRFAAIIPVQPGAASLLPDGLG